MRRLAVPLRARACSSSGTTRLYRLFERAGCLSRVSRVAFPAPLRVEGPVRSAAREQLRELVQVGAQRAQPVLLARQLAVELGQRTAEHGRARGGRVDLGGEVSDVRLVHTLLRLQRELRLTQPLTRQPLRRALRLRLERHARLVRRAGPRLVALGRGGAPSEEAAALGRDHLGRGRGRRRPRARVGEVGLEVRDLAAQREDLRVAGSVERRRRLRLCLRPFEFVHQPCARVCQLHRARAQLGVLRLEGCQIALDQLQAVGVGTQRGELRLQSPPLRRPHLRTRRRALAVLAAGRCGCAFLRLGGCALRVKFVLQQPHQVGLHAQRLHLALQRLEFAPFAAQ
mmetsp:Transcript_5400/g.14107  ORF Transcript_5400/g.14107 Transcript_5400/m.14107 type:complete len:342 (-) Transcript_5400:1087-2112(-)